MPADVTRAEVRDALAEALARAFAAHDLQAHGTQRPEGYVPDDCLLDVAERALRILGPWAVTRPQVVHREEN